MRPGWYMLYNVVFGRSWMSHSGLILQRHLLDIITVRKYFIQLFYWNTIWMISAVRAISQLFYKRFIKVYREGSFNEQNWDHTIDIILPLCSISRDIQPLLRDMHEINVFAKICRAWHTFAHCLIIQNLTAVASTSDYITGFTIRLWNSVRSTTLYV